MAEEFSVIGKRIPRHDSSAKAKGEVRFITDIKLPRMLEAKFLRSPHAHARIVKIETLKALALPGVKAVLTYKDVPKVHPYSKLEYLLDETLHYVGEEVAVVAAENKEIAEDALELIDVEYEVLPAVFDPEKAMETESPLVHPEYGSNMFHGHETQPVLRCKSDGWLTINVGDTDKGFAEADYIVESDFETPLQYHCSPLPRAVICEWSGDELTCYADTQVVMDVHHDLAYCLGMPQSKIKLICPPTVGNYGGKAPEKIATIVALLAKRTGRPVRAIFTREEDFIATRLRPDYKAHEKIGVKKDGTITAMSSRFITRFGRDNTLGFQDPTCAALNCGTLLYNCKNSKADVCTVMTNTLDCYGMNCFGDSEGTFCIDRLLDEAAEKIGMDPVDFRLKNVTKSGNKAQRYYNIMQTPPDKEIEWGVLGSDLDSFQECIKRVAEKSDWKKKWRGWGTPLAISGTKRKGIGVAIGFHQTVYMDYAGTIKMNHDGTASILSSGIEIGQGYGTAMLQVVAEVLGLQPGDIHIMQPNSEASPAGWGIMASCGVTSGVAAVWHAAKDVRVKLLDIASKKLGVDPNDLDVKNRKIYLKENPEVGMTIAEACTAGYQITCTAINPPPNSIRDQKTGKIIYPFACAATITEVEVDVETGQLDLLGLTSAHDVGRAINPQIVENQIDMSLTLANGYSRTEQYVIDKRTGAVLNPNLLDYKIMTILDMPKMQDIKEIYVEFPMPWGPLGAKGFSESGTTACAPSIANAVYNAIGVRIRGAHLSPDRILKALAK